MGSGNFEMIRCIMVSGAVAHLAAGLEPDVRVYFSGLPPDNVYSI